MSEWQSPSCAATWTPLRTMCTYHAHRLDLCCNIFTRHDVSRQIPGFRPVLGTFTLCIFTSHFITVLFSSSAPSYIAVQDAQDGNVQRSTYHRTCIYVHAMLYRACFYREGAHTAILCLGHLSSAQCLSALHAHTEHQGGQWQRRSSRAAVTVRRCAGACQAFQGGALTYRAWTSRHPRHWDRNSSRVRRTFACQRCCLRDHKMRCWRKSA